MGKKPNWDYALHIKGVDLKSLPMSAIAEYLKEFANLLGDSARPVLDGIVKGSVVLRARQLGDHPAITKNRLQTIEAGGESAALKTYQKLQSMLARDQASADVIDRDENVVVHFARADAANESKIESIIHDTGTIDGRVISITGADDTVHIKLLNNQQQEFKVTVRDLGLAKELASKFRGPMVRVQVHGTWKRDINGNWIGHSIYADSVEDLEEDSIADVMVRLKEHPGGWSNIKDPLVEWLDLRSGNDLHS